MGTTGSQPKNSAALLSLWDACKPGILGVFCCTCAVGRLYVHLQEMDGRGVWFNGAWVCPLPENKRISQSMWKQWISIHVSHEQFLNPCGNWLLLPPRLEYMGTQINRVGNGEVAVGKQLLSHHVCRKHLSYLVPADNGETWFSMIFWVLRPRR